MAQQHVLHHRPIQSSSSSSSPHSYSSISNRPIFLLSRNGLFLLLALLFLVGVFLPWTGSNRGSSSYFPSNWRDYSLAEAAKFVSKDGTVIVCAVSYPFLPFLNNWLISVSRQKHQEKVLVIAEDYATLYKVNEKWPGHAVLIPPALDSKTAQNFGSPGFFNFTSRRPQHLLQILELGYNVLYNDVDMVWLQDPFQFFEGSHDAYFTDDRTKIKPVNHSHDLPTPDRNGVTYICSCTIFLRPTNGAKLLMKTWIDELQAGSNGGDGIRRLTEGPRIDTIPCWSPKRDLIGFSSSRHKPANADVFGAYVVRPDGSGLRRIQVAGVGGSGKGES